MEFSSAWQAHKARHKMSVLFQATCYYCKDIQTQGRSASRYIKLIDAGNYKNSGKRRRIPIAR